MAHEEKARHCSCTIAVERLCSPTHRKTEYNSIASGSKSLEPSDLFCRVCHCAESDLRGDAALSLLDIYPPIESISKTNKLGESGEKFPKTAAGKCVNDGGKNSGLIEFISPDGEVFVCSDLEPSSYDYQNTLANLGCSCKNDLALAHYACALKWFISRGSTICEICGAVAKNIRPRDFLKVVSSLKEYESLREKTARGELAHIHTEINSSVDPDALAAVRRQRLNEVSFWFNPQNNAVAVLQEAISDLPLNAPSESIVAVENPTTTWAVEGTGILVATGLLTLTLAWLIAPHVGKVVLSRIKYGPARYWPILIIFWFLVFGIWASRTHGAHNA